MYIIIYDFEDPSGDWPKSTFSTTFETEEAARVWYGYNKDNPNMSNFEFFDMEEMN